MTCIALASNISKDRAPTSHTTVAALKLRFHWRVSEARGCLCGDTSQPTSQATGGAINTFSLQISLGGGGGGEEEVVEATLEVVPTTLSMRANTRLFKHSHPHLTLGIVLQQQTIFSLLTQGYGGTCFVLWSTEKYLLVLLLRVNRVKLESSANNIYHSHNVSSASILLFASIKKVKHERNRKNLICSQVADC